MSKHFSFFALQKRCQIGSRPTKCQTYVWHVCHFFRWPENKLPFPSRLENDDANEIINYDELDQISRNHAEKVLKR